MKNQNLDIFEYVFGCGVDAGLPRICGAGGEFGNLDKPLTEQQVLNIIQRAINDDGQLDEETAERLHREAREEVAQITVKHEELFNVFYSMPLIEQRFSSAIEHIHVMTVADAMLHISRIISDYGPREHFCASATAAELDMTWLPAHQQVNQHGPVQLFESLLNTVAADLGVTRTSAIAHIAQRGYGWTAGGRINVRVFKRNDGLTAVTWGTGGTECTLGDLLTAIELDNEVPGWFEPEWIEYEA